MPHVWHNAPAMEEWKFLVKLRCVRNQDGLSQGIVLHLASLMGILRAVGKQQEYSRQQANNTNVHNADNMNNGHNNTHASESTMETESHFAN